MMLIKVKLIGFRGLPQPTTISIQLHNENAKVSYIIKEVFSQLNINVDASETLVVCNDKILYLDEEVPPSCREIEVYPHMEVLSHVLKLKFPYIQLQFLKDFITKYCFRLTYKTKYIR
jgi:hypothetical protein